jgi:site-specific DNA recombinase
MPQPNASRVALYCRVSTDEQAQRYGLPSQLRECREVATQRGYKITASFSDEGISGATLDRPQLTALREAVRARTVDVVLTHDADRLSRSLVDQLVLDQEFRRAGVRLEFATYERRHDAEGLMFDQIKGVLAQYERVKIRERTRRGRLEAARQGKRPGGPVPFGYVRDRAEPGGLRIAPAEAAIVRQVFAWVLAGKSIRSIVRQLYAQGVRGRRGAIWHTSAVRRVVRNPLYSGQGWYNRTVTVDGTMAPTLRPAADWVAMEAPAIVSRPTFERAQAQLERNRALLSGRPSLRTYLLRGLLICGACGRKMSGAAGTGNRRMYRCTGRHAIDGAACRASARSAERLEAGIWDTVTRVLRDPEALRCSAQAKQLKFDAVRVDARTEIISLTDQRATLQRQRSRLLDLYVSDGIDKPTFTSRDAPLKAQEDAVAARLAQAEARLAQETTELHNHDALRAFCKAVRREVNRLDDAGRQALLYRVVERAVVHDARTDVHLKLDVTAPTTGRTPGKSSAGGHLSRPGNRAESQAPEPDHRDGGRLAVGSRAGVDRGRRRTGRRPRAEQRLRRRLERHRHDAAGVLARTARDLEV